MLVSLESTFGVRNIGMWRLIWESGMDLSRDMRCTLFGDPNCFLEIGGVLDCKSRVVL